MLRTNYYVPDNKPLFINRIKYLQSLIQRSEKEILDLRKELAFLRHIDPFDSYPVTWV